jgi:diguanylate cyclase (GGDEF)-like protein
VLVGAMWPALLTTVSVLALVVLAVALNRLSESDRQRRTLEQRATALERELAGTRRVAAQVEADQAFLARFVRELPHLAHELHAKTGGRQIPALLLGAMTRVLEPQKAVVLVRRRSTAGDPERDQRLAVAARSPAGLVPVGTEIPIGHGEIGYVAETRTLLARREFEGLDPAVRRRRRDAALPGFTPDVVAPMVFNEEVVGVVAIEGTRRTPTEAKDVLRLLAQVGAASLHAQAQFTEMKATASLDGLTGIYNKRHLAQRLGDEVCRAVETSVPLSVFLFDLDHFKHYNDRNGHVAGDRLLQGLARLVQDNVRKDGVFGRYGGEEFLVILPNTTRSQALAAAENVREAIAAHDFDFAAGQPLGVVSVSGGVAECPIDAADAAGLVAAADEALYRAKREGRNRVIAYQPTYLGEGQAQEPVDAEAEAELVVVGPTKVEAIPDFEPLPGSLFAPGE